VNAPQDPRIGSGAGTPRLAPATAPRLRETTEYTEDTEKKEIYIDGQDDRDFSRDHE